MAPAPGQCFRSALRDSSGSKEDLNFCTLIFYHMKVSPRKCCTGLNKILNSSRFLAGCSTPVVFSGQKGGKKVTKGNPHICVRLDEKTLSEIRMQAAAVGETVSGFVRLIICAYLEEHN